MASPDRDAPARVSCLTAVKSPSGSVRFCVPAFLIFSFAVLGAAPSHAQDQTQDQTQNQKDQGVAEAARQERARKESQQKKSKHVYTADDLKRDHILTPEDRAQIEARKNPQPPAPSAPDSLKPQDTLDAAASRDRRSPDRRRDVVDGATVAQDAGAAAAQDASAASPSANSENVPLGDVARRVRREKQSQQLQRSLEFQLPFEDAPVLASPKAPAQPLVPPAVAVDSPTVVQPAPRVVAPLRPFVKRSPFERPRVLPACPGCN